ncbi:hypothetical protein D9M70_418250 [compost metagenome]
MVLGVVADIGAVGPFHRAGIRRQVADQGAHQGGLADAVGADDRHAFAGLDLEAEILEQRLAVEALGQVFDGDRLAVQLLVLLEADERADELLQFGDLRLLLGVVREQAFAGLGGGGHVLVVVAGEQAQLAVVQVGHVRAHAVQEVTIVGNDDHRAVARGQHVFQPTDGVDVQVVGRLVEQQHFRIGEQCLGQQHAQLPARRHFAHRPEMLFQLNAQAEQQFAGAGFGGVAVHLGELGFQLGHRHAVLFAHFRQRIDALAFGLHPPQLGVAHDHGVDHRELLVGELILAQLAEAHVGLEHHLAGRGFEVVAEDLHESRFAAAVGTDQAVAVAVAELDGDVLEQGLGPELHGDVGCGDQELVLRAFQRWLIALLCSLYQFRTIFDPGRQLFELVPVGGRAQPFGIGREQHLHAMPKLACHERWVHAGHQAQGGVGVSGVVLPALRIPRAPSTA